VFSQLTEVGRQSIRKMAEIIGLSKDRVMRSLKSLSQRNRYPESSFWETEEGYYWLRLLVFAVLFEFGIKANQGADRLSTFFKRVRLERHVGVSPTALRSLLTRMEEELTRYQEIQGKQPSGTPREIIASGDETFFNEMMVLVLMDLSSGYVIVEEEAGDRSYETWRSKAEARLNQLGLKVRHFVSDRAQALIKLALDGFGCAAGADIFHAQHEVGKWLGVAFWRMLGHANKAVRTAKQGLESLRNRHANPTAIDAAEKQVEQAEADKDAIQRERDKYSETQQEVSTSVHAFSLEDNHRKTSAQVEAQLQQQMDRFQAIAQANSVDDNKGTLDKVRKQIGDLASIVDGWWLWVIESLVGYGLGKEKQDWLLYILLPVIYWHQQMEKSQHAELKKVYRKAWKKALAMWESHTMTLAMSSEEINQWLSWSEWISAKFQRASSAVEGRNGWLSQMHHNGRGLRPKRLNALTVIHNFDLKRRDGTTAAERLFNRQFPDLFEWLVGQMGELPLPRQPGQLSIPNPLNLQGVAA